MKSADHDNTSYDCFGIVSDCYSSGKHVQFRQAGLAFSSKGSFIGKERNGGGYNLYYPSTISVERIEGARITLITVDTSSNIMRNALLTPPTSIVVSSLIKILLRVRHNIVLGGFSRHFGLLLFFHCYHIYMTVKNKVKKTLVTKDRCTLI